jgi:1-deoxy-D-xylulose-5-phosphate synthase
MMTGRTADFDSLRQEGGLSGYPSQTESIHDIIENSHASTALSYADGIAKAFELHGETDRHVVAVVGDGALTGGMTWEAMNNIADGSNRSIIIVVNDNERSYSPTIGGMAHHLATLRTTRGYEKFLAWGKSVLGRTPVVGAPMYEALHGMKKGIKDFVAPQGLFEDLGLKYIGPVDGHNIPQLEFALQRAKEFGGPVIVHAITEKGRGHQPAENDLAEKFHAVGVVDPETGVPVRVAARTWTTVFSETMVRLADRRSDIVAITAAMQGPTGLDAMAKAYPSRTFDVGIAEQHAVTSAVGMAHAGLHPVIAVYATFLNRAIDQVLLDCALHRAGVTIALDRAGVTGDDGASHNGMWDLALLRAVPGLELAAPRDEQRLIEALERAVDRSDCPTVVRYPKGPLPPPIPMLHASAAGEVVYGKDGTQVTIVALGAMVASAIGAAKLLEQDGIGVRVLDPVWALPVRDELLQDVGRSELVVTIEDGLRAGGVGEGITAGLMQSGSRAAVVNLGLPKRFLAHASRASILAQCGLDADGISTTVRRHLAEVTH